MCHVSPGFGADFDLALVEDLASALADGLNPAIDGEDAGSGRTVWGDADGDQARVGKKELTKAGAVLVCRPADCGVDRGDELVERGGGGTRRDGSGDLRLWHLGTQRGDDKGCGEGEEN